MAQAAIGACVQNLATVGSNHELHLSADSLEAEEIQRRRSSFTSEAGVEGSDAEEQRMCEGKETLATGDETCYPACSKLRCSCMLLVVLLLGVYYSYSVRGDNPDQFAENGAYFATPSMWQAVAMFLFALLVAVVVGRLETVPWARQGQPLFPEHVRMTAVIVASVASFLAVGPALILLNKHILDNAQDPFPYPITVSALGLVGAAVTSQVLVRCDRATVRQDSLASVSGTKWFSTALPVGVCNALNFAAGNAVYLHLGMGFIQMLKAFTPAVALVVLRISGVAKPTRAEIFFVVIIVAGTLMEVKGSLNASAVGLFLMVVSEFMESFGLVLTQKLLQNQRFTIMEGMYILAPVSAMCLLLLAALVEWPSLFVDGAYEHVDPEEFFAAAVLGSAVQFVTFFLLQVTSAVMLKVLGTIRGLGVILIGILCYDEACSLLEAIGYGFAILGFSGYSYVQLYPEEGELLMKCPRRSTRRKTTLA